MLNTFAKEVIFAYNNGLDLKAYEFAYDNAASVRECDDHDVIRFSDNSEVKIYMSEDHEIEIVEA